ncbi:MAG: hypothetical protein KME29_34295 [Calothrix sp. FI2-JRJ7]|jgi:hypothetical protein|nr:hypothetical protein [Calothrix sp. FI2-JRJ7]
MGELIINNAPIPDAGATSTIQHLVDILLPIFSTGLKPALFLHGILRN